MSRRVGFALAAGTAILLAGGIGYEVGSSLLFSGSGVGGARTAGLEPSPVWLETQPPDVQFQTADGRTARLSDYLGQIVLLNFWGTWCPPCLVEIPHLIEVQRTLEAIGGTIIGPAVDSGSGEDVLRFGREHGINYPLWMSDYRTAVGEFGALGYPFTLLIDRDGVIRRQYLGPQSAKTLLRDIGALAVRDR
jgi:peroxiredoxin